MTNTETARAILAQHAAAVADARHTLDAHRTQLNTAVVDAIDNAGMSVPAVARTIGVSKARIYAIIASVCAQ